MITASHGYTIRRFTHAPTNKDTYIVYFDGEQISEHDSAADANAEVTRLIVGNDSGNVLFIDCESTKFKKGGPLIQERQARVCQLAMILTDDQGEVLEEFCELVKPDGWEISEEAQKVHGITLADCEERGIEQAEAIAAYRRMMNRASLAVAHNAEFDHGMMDVEEAYFHQHHEQGFLTSKEWFCTMRGTAQDFGGKNQKLAAALLHYTGKQMEQAHHALHDARACKDIFFAARKVA